MEEKEEKAKTFKKVGQVKRTQYGSLDKSQKGMEIGSDEAYTQYTDRLGQREPEDIQEGRNISRKKMWNSKRYNACRSRGAWHDAC